MPDREKVTKGLECCLVFDEDWIYKCDECPYRATEDERKVIDWRCHLEELRNDVLELLKEQESVVRCKDCKNANILPWLDNAIICKKHNYTGVRPEEFYCADGERR